MRGTSSTRQSFMNEGFLCPNAAAVEVGAAAVGEVVAVGLLMRLLMRCTPRHLRTRLLPVCCRIPRSVPTDQDLGAPAAEAARVVSSIVSSTHTVQHHINSLRRALRTPLRLHTSHPTLRQALPMLLLRQPRTCITQRTSTWARVLA